MDPRRATHQPRNGSGSVITMHPRHTVLLALAALVTTGCVAVPPSPAPRPPVARPGDLAAAADRPPAPIPPWPEPTQAAPREDLSTTDPRPSPTPARTTPAPAAPAPAHGQARHQQPPAPGRRTAPKTSKAATTRAASPKARAPKKQRPPRRQQQAPGQVPDMHRLCAQARAIQAPMGAADLCRSMYGR
ncbi:hypothetical protein ACFYUJ_38730 [Streptomyces sp. NPDC004520]|uniref:hypothetical protein n=1 Tax=Streptomyces sp. NPDC004520 TaxID=3364702 RepID=UPI0036A0D542